MKKSIKFCKTYIEFSSVKCYYKIASIYCCRMAEASKEGALFRMDVFIHVMCLCRHINCCKRLKADYICH